MSLLNKIRNISADAASVLEQAAFCTDREIKSLTQTDLHELFPGRENLKLRKTIFETIHQQKPVDALIKELKAFIPHEYFRAALTGSGVLVDYLPILREMKTQMNHVQGFLDAHISLLEDFSKDQPAQESDKGPSTSDTFDLVTIPNGQTGDRPLGAEDYLPSAGTSAACGPVVPYTPPTFVQSRDSWRETGKQGERGELTCNKWPRLESNPGLCGEDSASVHGAPSLPGQPSTMPPPPVFTQVTYQIIVSGQTFNAHQQLMSKVMDQDQDGVRFVESSKGHQITVLFCPISSRIGSDVEAAMSDVKDDKPVILVLMHHVHEPKHTTSLRTWSDHPNVVLHVNVFYHETMFGLYRCGKNTAAISTIRNKLLEYSTPKLQDASGIALGVVGESHQSAVAPDRRTNRGVADRDSRGSFWPNVPFFWPKST